MAGIIFSILFATILQIIVSEVPVLSNYLDTTSVPLFDMLILFLISTSILLIVELYKAIKKRRKL